MASGSRTDQTPPPPLPSRPSISVFDLPLDYFDSCRIISDPRGLTCASLSVEEQTVDGQGEEEERADQREFGAARWTCNTCKAEFESLVEQRAHFKSDLHRLNVKLNMAGKETMKEEEFNEAADGSLFEDSNISSISGSEDEDKCDSVSYKDTIAKKREAFKQKLHIRLQTGDIVSLWRCLLLREHEDLSFESISNLKDNDSCRPCVSDDEVINRLKYLIHEPRHKTHLRTVLLACGGHFAGCVFDGNSVVAHKTFHRYVVRAKAGKKQSAKDATGKAAYSAGTSLRRYNEAALKKEIQDLLVSWKSFFAASTCIFIHAPSKNYQYFFDGEDSILTCQKSAVRNVPLTVRRPTLKEAKRVFNHLTHITYVSDEGVCVPVDNPVLQASVIRHDNQSKKNISNKIMETNEDISGAHLDSDCHEIALPDVAELVICDHNDETPLHEAAKSGDVQWTLELLEQGADPCAKDLRGRTPYMLAKEKEVRNTFRRFMASNLEKWDWHAANVPSPLTKEMEESQAAKQAEKDAKRKAKAKELKKLKKAREKAQAQAALSQTAVASNKSTEKVTILVGKGQVPSRVVLSKEEERKRELNAERERRAAAAERRIASLNSLPTNQAIQMSTSESKAHQSGGTNDIICSCCHSSLAGKIPFHRYDYKYCSSTCMHVHREMLEDR